MAAGKFDELEGKKLKMRTEPLMAYYVIFLKPEKEKIDPKFSLKMPEICQLWKMLS